MQVPEEKLRDPKTLAVSLVSSAAAGNLACVKTLLDAGAAPNGTGFSLREQVKDQTPLVAAIQSQSPEIMRLLIDRGANPNLRALADDDSPGTPPLVAASARSSEMARLLMLKGADVNAPTRNGVSALHFAASRGDLELVRELIARGARTDSKDKLSGKTPLDWAQEKQHLEVVSYLKAQSRN
jgi:ankyrin repeat protein